MRTLKEINWNHLYGFYEVARAQSLKKGAEIINVSSSTLSEQLKKLEQNFDVTLFKRSSKGLYLTNDGLKLYEHTKTIFEAGLKILEQFSDDTVGGYPLKIGIEDTLSHDVMSEFTSRYWDLYAPYGTINTIRQIGHRALVDNLRHGNIDWGISLSKPTSKDLDYSEIDKFEVVFCCSQELFEKFKDVKDLLINIPFVESSWDKNINKLIANYLSGHGVIPKEKIFSEHPDIVKKLCQRGRCIMYMPKIPNGDYDGLQTFTLEKNLQLSFYAIWNKKDSGLISIKMLNQQLDKEFAKKPARYDDVDLQIEVSEIDDDMLV